MPNPQLKKISTRDIYSNNNAVRAIFCVRNEKFRLAHFLQYHRNLGIAEFFAVDNDSSDGTLEYLLTQNDVHVFSTSQPYKESNAGRDWTSALANEYCIGSWCLTLDVDELFVFPLMEYLDLPGFIKYLDNRRFEGVLSVFLDFYSNRAL